MKDIEVLLKSKNINLTSQQLEAASHVNGPALILAVPGAGKTTVIMGRIANLIRNCGVRGDKILAITFSKASAIDMTKRFETLFSEDGLGNVRFSTIHAFGNWVVSSYNKRFGIQTRLITTKEALDSIKESYHKSTGKFLTEDSIEGYTTAISYIKNKMLNNEDAQEYAKSSKIEALMDVITGYENYKKDNNLYDYDDMLLNTINILKSNAVTLDFLQKKYQHIIIDEGQDTSPLQYEIVSLLVSNKDNLSKNVYIVGDDDQNIYGFRGITSEVILKIEQRFPGIKTYYMENNFRSQKNIINIANELIKNNENRFKKTIVSTREKQDKVKIVQAKDLASQSRYILENINLNEGSTAILYRNNISAVTLANILKRKEIEFYAGSYKPGFFNHWVTYDIFAIINLLLNEADIRSFSKIYYKIETYLTKKIIKDLEIHNNEYASVFDFLIDTYHINRYQKDTIKSIKASFKRARNMKPHKGLEHLMIHLGYFDYLDKKGSESNASSTSLIQIAETIIEIARDVERYEDIKEKLKELNETLNQSRTNSGAKLHLSTLHSSKGLEFDNVLIVNANDGVIPSAAEKKMSKNEAKEYLEGERRLFFVGITRAKNKLHIIYTENPSKFIYEIKEDKDSIDCIKA